MPGTQAEKAAMYGVSVATISRWGSSEQAPRDPAIIAKIKANGGPTEKDWETPVLPPPARPAVIAVEATASSVQAQANRLMAMVDAGMTEADQEADVGRRAGILANLANITRQLGRVVGAGHVVTERQILDSPHWRLMCERIVTALEPWPEALASVAAALEGPSAQPA